MAGLNRLLLCFLRATAMTPPRSARPRVLSVGNCGFDHRALSEMLQQYFSGEVDAAATARDALRKITQTTYDLVLVKRQFDADGDSGLDLIRRIKSEPAHQEMPVMLISNYPEYQKVAVAAGALPGFGKAELGRVETRERVKAALGQAEGSVPASGE